MFINISGRRVNVNTIQEYVPETKQSKYYYIKIKYHNGSEEKISFFGDKEKRDSTIKQLDELTKLHFL